VVVRIVLPAGGDRHAHVGNLLQYRGGQRRLCL
jgi:hypothetical protein